MKRFLAVVLTLSALSTAHADDIIINEIMASNAGMVMSPATNFDSWIELYNPTDKSINLGDMYLSDDADNLTLFHLKAHIL